MSGIKRYLRADANGEYVLYSDHEAEVARLRAELADAHAAIESKAGWEWKKEADRMRSEMEACRKDAERYRWIRSPCAARAGSLVGLHCGGEMDYQIDKAMGDPV